MNAAGERPDAPSEDLEGYTEASLGLDDYPLDGVLIRTEQRTIRETLSRIDEGVFVLKPDYQRDFVWSEEKQSRLIESVLMRIPLPVFYVAEDMNGRMLVVDGLQRLTTFQRFQTRKLTLSLRNPAIAGKDIQGLPPKLRRRFEDGQLVFYSIDSHAPERVRLDIFERVNSGVPLTRQQMRNALYNGAATSLLIDLVSTDEFKDATGFAFDKQPRYRLEQLDREAVNRFLAFRELGWESYTGDMEEFLGRALQETNKKPESELRATRDAFVRSMGRNSRIFGRHAFCKHESPNERKKPFNILLFEVFSVLFASYAEGRFTGKEDAVRHAFYGLMKDQRFMRAIGGGTTAPENVKARFKTADDALVGVLGAP